MLTIVPIFTHKIVLEIHVLCCLSQWALPQLVLMHLQEYFDPGTSTAIFRQCPILAAWNLWEAGSQFLRMRSFCSNSGRPPLAMTRQSAAGAHHSITQPKKYLRDRGELSLYHAHLCAYQPGALNGVFQLHEPRNDPSTDK